MAWVDGCNTAEDVRRLARATEARRRASWAKPEPLPTPSPIPEPSDDLESAEGVALTIGGQPVKSNWETIYEFAKRVRQMQEGDRIPKPPKIDRIIAVTARHFQVSVNDIKSQRRTKIVVLPRQVAMYLAKTLTPKSLPEIGRGFCGRDHTTVLHAVRKIARLIETDEQMAAAAAHLTAVLERSS